LEIILFPAKVEQPEVYRPHPIELHVAIASLSLGGAERIVLDWVERIYPRFRVHLIVLRNRTKEWPVPPFVRVTRLGGTHLPEQLLVVGERIAKDNNPVCVCHLLNTKERQALALAGATIVPVFHNAKAGWTDGISLVAGAPYAIAVSEACSKDLRSEGWNGTTTVIRHIPKLPRYDPNTRTEMRHLWNIPQGALVIGMLGALKPQKNYSFALQVFKEFLFRQDAYLVIIGGPVNTGVGKETWEETVALIQELGIRGRVALPGFIPDASRYLTVFDCLLNTSHFEGLSIATLEALIAGIPVVASEVGGQGEITHDSLTLLPPESKESAWGEALRNALQQECIKPKWADFPSYRLWTLAGIARQVPPSQKTLFVTANLSSGGAQRSLVNLVKVLRERMELKVMVAGKSSVSYFLDELTDAGIGVARAGTQWNVFDYTETIMQEIVQEGFGTVCFWNVDPRVKLLLVKVLAFTEVRFVDVSPGEHSFEEMAAMEEFQQLIAFNETQFLERIDRVILKYHADIRAGYENKTTIIRNGVPICPKYKADYSIQNAPRVVVSGRIAPTKYLLEIVQSMHLLWERIPETELHIIGGTEYYHQAYFDELMRLVGDDVDKRIKFYGPRRDVRELLHDFDAYVVLGKHQGCPNALLEALAAGLPVIGNDDGGTREQIIDNVTGLLIEGTNPEFVSEALWRVLSNRALAKQLGETGRVHVCEAFSMGKMVDAYEKLFQIEECFGTRSRSQGSNAVIPVLFRRGV
jgi:glycosyltransferase involved in cell wall biosynthesis